VDQKDRVGVFFYILRSVCNLGFKEVISKKKFKN